MKKLNLLFAALLTATVMNLQAAEAVSYLYPEYNTAGDPTSGIKEWKTGSCTSYTEVTNSTGYDPVTWNAGWYVVKGANVTLSAGAVCNGAVHLILKDGAKLTTKGTDPGQLRSAGITVEGASNSITIYGQANQTGELIAIGYKNQGDDGGAGIGTQTGDDYQSLGGPTSGPITINGGKITATGGNFGCGIGGAAGCGADKITINGGTIVATGGLMAAGIGCCCKGFFDEAPKVKASNITINGGNITAKGGKHSSGCGAGIGCGPGVDSNLDVTCENIYINGGTISAEGGYYDNSNIGASIGAGGMYSSASKIFVNPSIVLKAGSSANPTDVIAPTRTATTDISGLLGKQFATAAPGVLNMRDYLYFVSLKDNGTVKLNKTNASLAATFQYSKDRINWSDYTWPDNSGKGGAAIDLKNAGDTVFFRAQGVNYNGKNADVSGGGNGSAWFTFAFGADDQIAAGGNIMSLYDASCEQDTMMTAYGFICLFTDAKQLVSAAELKLPAKNLAKECYMNLFLRCTALTSAPNELKAPTLAEKCYACMFEYCSALTQAPELKATKLATACYLYMFQGCSNLQVDACADGSCEGVKFEPTHSGTAPNAWNKDMFAGCKGTAANNIQLGGHYCIKEYIAPYTRNVTNGKYGTICLDRKFSAMEGVEGLYKPATQATDSSVLYCTEVLLSEVKAGESYIFKADSDVVVFTLEGEAATAAVVANNMLGNLGDTVTVDAGLIATYSDYSILGTPAGANDQQVVKLVEDSKLLPNRAMINLKTVPAEGAPSAPGRRIATFGRNVATGMVDVNANVNANRKMMVNDQLIIIRDGVKFNAMGVKL